MADSQVPITSGSGTSIDTRTESTNSHHRQVIVIGDPSINNNVATVASQDLGGNDQTTPGAVVRLAGSASVQIVGSSGTVGVHISSTGGTLMVSDKSEPTVIASGKDGTTTRSIRMNSDGAIKVYDIAAGSVTVSGTITGITNTIGVYLSGTSGTQHVYLDPGTTLEGIQSSVAVYIGGTSGTLQVRLVESSAGLHTDDTAFTPATDVGVPVMGLFDDTATDSVDEGDAGVLRMTGNRLLMTHTDSTASIFTATGSTSGGTTSGVTLISPSANYSFKIFAYSIQTTGIVSSAIRFTNGAGSETELWRPLITAASTSSSPVGANLAVTPPGYIFATGVSTTLALKNDSGSLVHYSVSYFKESA